MQCRIPIVEYTIIDTYRIKYVLHEQINDFKQFYYRPNRYIYDLILKVNLKLKLNQLHRLIEFAYEL